LFAASMVVHLVIWKASLPKRQIPALLVTFAAVFLTWLAFALTHHFPLVAALQVALYYWSVSLSYTITYSAIEADSPTLSIMRFVAQGGPAGRLSGEIARFMDERPFLTARLTALIRSGLIQEREGRYVAPGPQPLAFRVILGFRKLYGAIPKGG